MLRTAAAMRALGATVEQRGSTWSVCGRGVGGLREPADVLDMGNSGTSARLIAGLLSAYPFTTFLTGDASLRGRPMDRVIKPLSQTGARFVARTGGRLPMAITGSSLIGGLIAVWTGDIRFLRSKNQSIHPEGAVHSD
jgi:3-phosphoshikimate 1-carboxyvinyltransferase